MCYYFYKSDTDEEEVESGKYVDIPNKLITDYRLESVNHYKENCSSRIKNGDSACSYCDCNDEIRYKITRENSKQITKDMDNNKTLFDDLMDSIGQDFIWIRWDW